MKVNFKKRWKNVPPDIRNQIKIGTKFRQIGHGLVGFLCNHDKSNKVSFVCIESHSVNPFFISKPIRVKDLYDITKNELKQIIVTDFDNWQIKVGKRYTDLYYYNFINHPDSRNQ